MLWLVAVRLLAVILPVTVVGQTCSGRSNAGRRFTIAFMQQYESHTDGILSLMLSADSSGHAKIDCTNSALQTVQVETNATAVAIDAPLHVAGTGKSSKKCTITSDVNIQVKVLDVYRGSNFMSLGAYLALPDDVLSTDYVIASYGVRSPDNGEMLVTCLQTCHVNVTLGKSVTSLQYQGRHYTPGDVITETLHSESLQLMSDVDMSGTRVRSDSPVAVYAGSQCSNVPKQFDMCDLLAEQMIPTDSWGKQYIVPMFYQRTTVFVRIFVKEDQTNVTRYMPNKQESGQISLTSSFEEYQFSVAQTPVVIESDKPIMVVLYSASSEQDHKYRGGPSMIVLPSTEQFNSNPVTYKKSTHSPYSTKLLILILPSYAEPRLSFTGVSTTFKHVVKVQAPLQKYRIIYFTIYGGEFEVTSKYAPFGALVYGTEDRYYDYSFGLPMKMGFPNTGNCTSQAVSASTATPSTNRVTSPTGTSTGLPSTGHLSSTGTPTSPRTTPTTSMKQPVTSAPTVITPPHHINTPTPPQPITATSHSPSSTPPSSSGKSGLTCFTCTDVSRLQFCSTVSTCRPGQVCYVSTSVSHGHTKYKSGCVDPSACTAGKKRRTVDSRAAGGPCLSCCTSDFCNARGCGDSGFPPLSARGPLCLDCGHVGAVKECGVITQCSTNQMCSIERHSWGDTDSLYKLGCKGKLECSMHSRRAVVARHERSVPECQACCVGDFCNTNCTAPSSPPVGLIG